MRDFMISDRVGYFVADNASNNDAALRQIAKEIDIDPLRQRIRCSAHILNLVAKAILYVTDSDCVADAAKLAPRFDSSEFDNVLPHTDKVAQPRNNDSASLAIWRKRCARGRCHNLVYHVKGSPRRRRYFESKQREISDSCIYQLVANGGIRWNSDLEMIERALKLKNALQLYQDRYVNDDADPLDHEDCLNAEDWNELKVLKDLLQPLKDASIRCQTVPGDGHHGGLWQTLSTTEWLLSKFEDLKRQPLSQYFFACINLGWKKLNKYYELRDASPAHNRFPVLRHLAFEIFAYPASSATDERAFSLAGNVLNNARHNTQEELAEAYQGLRS